jgi:hypothetical protein
MKRDGFSDKMQPQEWTFRLFSAVSPSFVEKFFGCEGADLLVLLSEAQYADNALSGFAQSLRLRGEKIRAAQFVAALYAQKNKAIFVRDLDLINLLDTEDAEKIAEYFISFLPPDEHYQYHPVGRLITHYSQNWSEKLTQIFVKALRKIFLSEKSPRYGLYWEDETALFAMKAPTEFVPRLLKYFSDEKRYLPYWEKSVGNMRQTWLIRQNFFESFAAFEN